MNASKLDIARFFMGLRAEDRGYATPCWVWQHGTNGRYGQFYLRDGPQLAVRSGRIYVHRFSWWFAHGELPPSAVKVCHRCDVELCANWDHLFTGTQADNLADMSHKERSANIKLSRSQRADIASRHIHGGERQRDLADEFNVSRGLVSQIVCKSRSGLI